MNTVNRLLEGANPYKALQNEAAKLSGKWNKSGLLEGIESSTEQNNMAILLENQAKQLVNEANSTGTGASFSSGNSEAWAGVALPLVRRVFGEIVAKDLVSVQPMNLPAGLIFYLDFQYGTADQPQKGLNESLYGATADLRRTDGAFDKGLYGAGEYGYSAQVSKSEAIALSPSNTASATFSDILQFDTEFSASNAGNFGSTGNVTAGTIVTFKVATSSLHLAGNTASSVGFDKEAIRSFKISGSAAQIAANYPQFTRIKDSNIEFVVKLGGTAAQTGNVFIQSYKGPDNLDDRGDFEDTTFDVGSPGITIPEINVQLRSDTVAAKTRKLKAQWTPEFAQDLNAYHSIDAEAELTSILSEYISMEIDLEILDMLIANADTTSAWSAKIAREVSDAGAITDEAGSGVYYTKMSWFQTLGVKLQKVSNLIHQKTLRGGANWIVVGPKVSTILESIPGFAADSAGDEDKYNMGVQKVGAINNRYTVYKNPYITENVILMGYKGSQFLETGAVFAPYIPLIMTPLGYDPSTFTPRKGIMTRYAKKMVRPDFYGKVTIADLNEL